MFIRLIYRMNMTIAHRNYLAAYPGKTMVMGFNIFLLSYFSATLEFMYMGTEIPTVLICVLSLGQGFVYVRTLQWTVINRCMAGIIM